MRPLPAEYPRTVGRLTRVLTDRQRRENPRKQTAGGRYSYESTVTRARANVIGRLRAAPGSDADQGPREVVGVERAEVFERLADADELDRDPKLARDRQRDAALRGP